MSGMSVIGELLYASGPLVAVVPVERIKAGLLPEDTPLPAIVATSVSLVERQTLRRRGFVRMDERIAVTVRAANYEERDEVLRLIRNACRGMTGTIAGVAAVAVRTAGAGPELRGPGGSFERTQDFRVGFDAPD